MGRYFINGTGSVSAQDTSNEDFQIENYEPLNQSVVFSYKPDYKQYIRPSMIRRMSNGVKMGVVASSIALAKSGIDKPDAIITGSGMGCLKDSEKFLESIINNNEAYLTPTSFIQSTHNTVGGQIALGLSCKSYNVTYVHHSNSFESALIDCMLILEEGAQSVLVGGVDEIGVQTTEFNKLLGYVKKEKDIQSGILNSTSEGSIFSEGAQFFVLEKEKSASTIAELIDVAIFDRLKMEDIEDKLDGFLGLNNLSKSDIDLIVLGFNGDVNYDSYYDSFKNNIFVDKQQIYYKHLSGEYNTASSFGLWIAAKLFKLESIPQILKVNKKNASPLKYILLYNQYLGKSHSFTLLSSC